MDESDVILALAICDLLGKSVTPKDVEKAFEKAKKRLIAFAILIYQEKRRFHMRIAVMRLNRRFQLEPVLSAIEDCQHSVLVIPS